MNKPGRPIPSGRVTETEALQLAGWLYVAAFVLAALVGPQCTLLAGTAAVLTVLYSAPPFRFKAVPYLANVVIAIPRGVLLKVAGWSCVRDFGRLEPWYIGAIFGFWARPRPRTRRHPWRRPAGSRGRTRPGARPARRSRRPPPSSSSPAGVHQGYPPEIPVPTPSRPSFVAWGLYVPP